MTGHRPRSIKVDWASGRRPNGQRNSRFGDRTFVDTGEAQFHQPIGIELPVLVAVGTEPLAAIIVEFVSKAHSDAVAGKGPEFLDHPVVEFARSFADQ